MFSVQLSGVRERDRERVTSSHLLLTTVNMIRAISLLPVLLLSLTSASSLDTKDGGHHPNSVYSQISAHKKKDLRIFYQNGVSVPWLLQLSSPSQCQAGVSVSAHMVVAGYFYQYCKILTVSQSQSLDA